MTDDFVTNKSWPQWSIGYGLFVIIYGSLPSLINLNEYEPVIMMTICSTSSSKNAIHFE